MNEYANCYICQEEASDYDEWWLAKKVCKHCSDILRKKFSPLFTIAAQERTTQNRDPINRYYEILDEVMEEMKNGNYEILYAV